MFYGSNQFFNYHYCINTKVMSARLRSSGWFNSKLKQTF